MQPSALMASTEMLGEGQLEVFEIQLRLVPHTHILALVDRFGFPEQSYRDCSFPPGNGWSESQMASLVPENDSEAYSQA